MVVGKRASGDGRRRFIDDKYPSVASPAGRCDCQRDVPNRLRPFNDYHSTVLVSVRRMVQQSTSKSGVSAYSMDDDSYSQTYTLDFEVTGYGEGTVADQNVTVNDKDEVGWKGYPGYVDGFNDNPAVGTVNELGGSFRYTYTVVPLSRPSATDGSGARVRLIIRVDDSTKINHNFYESIFQPLEPGNYTDGFGCLRDGETGRRRCGRHCGDLRHEIHVGFGGGARTATTTVLTSLTSRSRSWTTTRLTCCSRT